MRFALALALAVGLVISSAATASAPLQPPVVHTALTSLPCPKHPTTTVELEGCAGQAILATNRAINARAKAIFGLLRTRSARVAFVSSERAWLRFRKGSCTTQASFYDGGSAQPVVYANCLAARNRTHLRDLAELETTLGQH